MSTMQAAVLRTYGQPLEIDTVPVPDVTEDEVLVRVRATGICGTDLKILAGTLVKTPLPLIPGHEVAGEVAEDAGDLRRGQPVACYIYTACGTCFWCRAGQESICPTATRIGFEDDGGLAQYIRMRRRNVIPFRPGLSFEAAAVAMDAVLTPWRALRVRAQVQPEETVVIGGAGGLGLNGVQIALDAGARVAVMDPIASHRAEAERLGAELAVDPGNVDQVVDWSDGGAIVGLETSGKRAGFDAIVKSVRDGGRIVCCGYEIGKEYGMDSVRFALQEMIVMGCRAGTLQDAQDALQAVERGAITPTISQRLPLEDVNEAFTRLKAGEIVGRLVVTV
jgi:alcohol dehydrogenase, propanol-preferring